MAIPPPNVCALFAVFCVRFALRFDLGACLVELCIVVDAPTFVVVMPKFGVGKHLDCTSSHPIGRQTIPDELLVNEPVGEMPGAVGEGHHMQTDRGWALTPGFADLAILVESVIEL